MAPGATAGVQRHDAASQRVQFCYLWIAESGERGREVKIYSTLDVMRKACARTGDTGMGIPIHPEEVTKGSLEEAVKLSQA